MACPKDYIRALLQVRHSAPLSHAQIQEAVKLLWGTEPTREHIRNTQWRVKTWEYIDLPDDRPVHSSNHVRANHTMSQWVANSNNPTIKRVAELLTEDAPVLSYSRVHSIITAEGHDVTCSYVRWIAYQMRSNGTVLPRRPRSAPGTAAG